MNFKLNFVCLLTNEKYKKNIRWDCYLVTRIMPQGWDLGYCGGWGHFFLIQSDLVCELHGWHMQWHNILDPRPLGLGEGSKGKISSNLNNKVNSKDF